MEPAAAPDHAVPKEFTWRGLTFVLVHDDRAQPGEGQTSSWEYCCQLEGESYVTVWSYDGARSWCAQLERSVEADEPLAGGAGTSPEAALMRLIAEVDLRKRIFLQLEGRMLR